MLSIIIPVRNESDNLNDILEYYSNNLLDFNHEILIVNDFSQDDTLKKATTLFSLSLCRKFAILILFSLVSIIAILLVFSLI